MSATTERRGERYRLKQRRADPTFEEQRAHRVTQLYNEVRWMNPKLTGDEVMEQAKMLESRETVAAAQEEMKERRKVRKAGRTDHEEIQSAFFDDGGDPGRGSRRRRTCCRFLCLNRLKRELTVTG